MKEHLKELLSSTQEPLQGRHLLREYLQARILGSLQEAGAMIPLAFHGGTALRFLFQIPRFSEDLDFALERSTERYDFRAYLKRIQADLTAEDYPVELRVNDQGVVHSAFVRFRGLLYELDLSAHSDEVISIKVEVDARPPAGAGLQTTILQRYVMLNLQHHDRASLLAGKLHAVLQRSFVKGRDLYDLFWYLSQPGWPEPNLVFLNNALGQTGWEGESVHPDHWRQILKVHVEGLDWDRVLPEVRMFVMSPESAKLLTRENLLNLIEG